MIINPYRFAAGAPPQLPTHWWNLNNIDAVDADDGLYDQGTKRTADWDLTRAGTSTSAGGGPNGQDVLDFTAGNTLSRTNTGWDGDNDLLTVSVWYNLDAYDTSGAMVIQWRNAAATDFIFQINNAPSNDEIRTAVSDDTPDLSVCVGGTNSALTAEGWIHVAITWDGTTHRLYKNGSEVDTDVPGDITTLDTGSIPFIIGQLDSDNDTNFDGKMGMIGIWDVALEQSDIDTLYNGGNGNQYADIWT